ncbi:ankyrin repeat and MYND domain-containing protein 2-like [Amblyomma americanum]|uniref:MYND-type domain-containing protein n=1 Tax=Amblyomma americanum TaxID=6943 RepID=A0AAQ4FDG1_AMBAM
MAPPVKGELSDAEKELYKAIQAGDVSEARTLLNRVRIDCLDEHGMTPLQHAAYRGNYDLCKLFLECGADVNSRFHDSGYTALMFAGLAGRADVVSLLLEHGASTTAVNSVGRTAAQMAAFVSNHDVVAIINNFLPREELEYYARPQGLDKEPKLPATLVSPLYQLIVRTNIHPVYVALYLQEKRELLDQSTKVERVLNLLCEKQMKAPEPNEMLALKFHHLAFLLRTCCKFLRDRAAPATGGSDSAEGKAAKKTSGLLEPLVKTWLRGRDEDDFPVLLEKLLRQSVREFPYHECTILQQLVHTLSGVEVGNEPSAISILDEAVRGQKGCDQGASCTTCGEPQADKRCSACKSVQYCGATCQKLHWFTHKRHCARLAAEHQKALAEKAAQEECEQRAKEEETSTTTEQATEKSSKEPADNDSAETQPASNCASAVPIKTT